MNFVRQVLLDILNPLDACERVGSEVTREDRENLIVPFMKKCFCDVLSGVACPVYNMNYHSAGHVYHAWVRWVTYRTRDVKNSENSNRSRKR